MFARHEANFAAISTTLAVKGAMMSLSTETMVETDFGWRAVKDLKQGDAVATLDGGFVPLSWISDANATSDVYLAPAGALDNCSDVLLPGDTLVGIETPEGFDGVNSDTFSLPLKALDGTRGIRRAPGALANVRILGFENEEMLWAQTGMLVHARPIGDAFFDTLGFAEARAFAALDEAGHFGNALAA